MYLGNFDGVIDAKDLAYVESNYMIQNQIVKNVPKPVKKYKGKTIEDIKKDLGL
ncbi:hypothetical protein ACFVR2_06605 [Gottfriedia sp. NPDC057991]|uniref:hypothetical protein n=1 Tax=Gottfriedia sp. NPDC057991 TaxID=3346298 RepID=UPI0036DBE2C1